MNRAQKRKLLRKGFLDGETEVKNRLSRMPIKDEQPDFSGVPIVTLCQGIQLLIKELRNRGYPVYDFDHKEKFVQGIQIIRDKVYFLVAKEADDGETQAGNKENGK